METKHTQGEWEFYHGVGIKTKSQHIADITFVGDFNETMSNAKLIAAAPELLDALNLCVKIFEDNGYNGVFSEEKYFIINAIKKATE